jgi:hypothetical protein
MAELEKKIDRLIRLLEDQEMASYRQGCTANKKMAQELILNTILASTVGYLMFRILDIHLNPNRASGR